MRTNDTVILFKVDSHKAPCLSIMDIKDIGNGHGAVNVSMI